MDLLIIQWAIELSSKAKIVPKVCEVYAKANSSANVDMDDNGSLESLSNHLDMDFLNKIKNFEHLKNF